MAEVINKTKKWLDEFKVELDTDTTINETEIVEKLCSVPHLHSKWLHKYLIVQDKYEKQEIQVRKVYGQIYNELKSKSEYRVDSNQITKIIEGDERYIAEEEKLNSIKIPLKFLEESVKKVGNLGFLLNTLLETKKFLNGK